MPSSACRYRPPRPPGQRVAKRNARKEEFVKCDFAPRSKMHRTAGINYQACCAPRRVRRRASQTRRHPLTPTPVQQLCTHVQSCGQKRSFLLDRARPVFFSTRWKRKWGVHLPSHQHGCHSASNGTHSPRRAPAGLFRDQSIDWRNQPCHITFPLSLWAAPRTR